MEKFNMAPDGVTESVMSQNGKGMPDSLQPSGWRKVTAGVLAADQLAKRGEATAITKTRAFCAVKRVGAHIGMRPADLMLLDTLGAFTEPQDWEEGRRPIVWPSNARLMDQTGFSLSALKRHIRRLAENGLIAFKDSSNGKRWGHRGLDGTIKEAYGFDLSPLAVRAVKFEVLYGDLQAERELYQSLKRQITIARRKIRSHIEAAYDQSLTGPWKQIAGIYEELVGSIPRKRVNSHDLDRILASFRDLLKRVDLAYRNALDPVDNSTDSNGLQLDEARKLAPRQFNTEHHILTTNKLQKVKSNGAQIRKVAKSVIKIDRHEQTDNTSNSDQSPEGRESAHRIHVDIETIRQACPEFSTWARHLGSSINDWNDLTRIAGQLAPMIGLSKNNWFATVSALGERAATAALALVFDKHVDGEVVTPAAYLNGMIKKAGAGELHLDRSFYGRLNVQYPNMQ